MLFGQFNLWVRVAAQAGGCFSLPSEDSVAYTELLFDICQQFGIHYYAATKRTLFVEAVTLVTWTKQQEENSCIPQNTLSAFST